MSAEERGKKRAGGVTTTSTLCQRSRRTTRRIAKRAVSRLDPSGLGMQAVEANAAQICNVKKLGKPPKRSSKSRPEIVFSNQSQSHQQTGANQKIHIGAARHAKNYQSNVGVGVENTDKKCRPIMYIAWNTTHCPPFWRTLSKRLDRKEANEMMK